MTATIILRPATIDDLPLLKHWDAQPHNIESDPNDDWDWESELLRQPPWREQLIAELNGNPIGFIQIIDPYKEETHYWGDVEKNYCAIDIWIGEKENLNQGYGTQMMKLAIAKCFNKPGVIGILIDPLKSNIHAHRFYERLGFKFIEERMFGEDCCYVYGLEKL